MTTFETVRSALAGTYRIEREVGQGGMARVYLAHDVKHDRNVAVKVLDDRVAGAIAAERFVREIMIAARLTHPHILPLIDSGYAGEHPYYVMPYVDGESVRDRLDRAGAFAVDEAVALVREVADALDYAHVAGVVHRDIKPENVLLLGSHAVVLDFGVGRAISEASDSSETGGASITAVGMVIGTPAYMSPEQAAGELNTDGRSDLYSLALMLFEMVTGRPAFQGPSSQAIIAKRFFETPPRLDTIVPTVPSRVAEAVERALAREPVNRYDTVGAFGRALAGGTTTSFTVADIRVAQPSIAVMPFANVGGNPENEFLSDGLTDEIISALIRLRTIRVAARTSSYAMRDEGGDIGTIGARLKVASVLEGSVRRAGSRVRVTARLVSATDGFQQWADQYDEQFDDVFAIQDRISQAIAGALAATITGVGVTGGAVQATNAKAYELYLRGRFHWNRRTESQLQLAVDLFQRASAEDADYAPAYAGLADSYAVLGTYGARAPKTVFPRAREAAQQALARDPSLADPHAALGLIAAVHDYNWEESERAFARALTLAPAHVTTRVWRAMALHVPHGRYDRALHDLARARTEDPLSMVVRMSAAAVLDMAGRHDEAIADFEDALAVQPDFAMAHYFLASALQGADRLGEATASIERAISLTGGSVEMRSRLAQTLAMLGDGDAADAIADELTAERATSYVAATQIAQVHAARGRSAEALRWLAVAADERDSDLVYLGAKRSYDMLRGEPEFVSLLQALHLPPVKP